MSKIRIAAALLLILTAILHLVQPLFYGFSSMAGYFAFGAIYLVLGVLLIFVKGNLIVWACLILSAIGLGTSLYENIKTVSMLPVYPVMAVIDLAVIVLCWMELNGQKKRKL